MMTFLLFCIFGGVLFIGKTWGKVRPMVEIEDEDGVQYHAGISHSKKDGMVELNQDDIQEPNNFNVGEGAYVGLSNKSPIKMKYGDIGSTSEELDNKILNANEKLRAKIAKRSRKK